MAETNNPLALPTDFDSEQNGLNFAIQQSMLKLQTSLPVRVDAVRSTGVSPSTTCHISAFRVAPMR
jgi:hypothetical protein